MFLNNFDHILRFFGCSVRELFLQHKTVGVAKCFVLSHTFLQTVSSIEHKKNNVTYFLSAIKSHRRWLHRINAIRFVEIVKMSRNFEIMVPWLRHATNLKNSRDMKRFRFGLASSNCVRWTSTWCGVHFLCLWSMLNWMVSCSYKLVYYVNSSFLSGS